MPADFVPPPPRETPGAFDLLILFGVLVAGGIVAFVVGAVGMTFWLRGAHISSTTGLSKQQMYAFAIPLQVLWYLMTAAIAVPVFRSRWKKSFGEGIHWDGHAASSRAWMLIAGGVFLSFVVQVASARIKMPTTAPIYELFKNQALAWTATFFGIFVAPAAEELAFRGFLLPVLARNFGKVAGIVVTSAIFALLHAEQIGHAWAAVAILFGVSVVLCLFRLRFNSVAVSTLVHMSYNSVLFLAMIYATGGYRHFDKIPH
jgi:membrane protease YdiL (CAAX protease family)